MSKLTLPNNITRTIHKIGFKLKKHSPEILAVAGTVGVVASGVMACRATTKLSKVMEEHKEQTTKTHKYVETQGYSDEYSEQDYKKDITIIYTQTGFKLVKLYAPSVALGVLSITAMLTSNNILRKRNIALGAAYAAVDRGFKEYRNRVVERFGNELDKELRYNIKSSTIEETIEDENGKKKKVKKTVNVIDPNAIDDFSRIFYEGNIGWDPDPQYTLMFLKKQQAFATERLERDGFLFLNDVYEMLGFNRTKEGQAVGWIYDEKNPVGDNFVDFGIYDLHNDQKIKFVNGDERGILLEFNHDGNILEKM